MRHILLDQAEQYDVLVARYKVDLAAEIKGGAIVIGTGDRKINGRP